MLYELIITSSYKNKEKRFLNLHPDLSAIYAKILLLLKTNPNHTFLRLHKLKGKMREFYSISVNLQYRIVIDFVLIDGKIIPLDIGDHDIYERW